MLINHSLSLFALFDDRHTSLLLLKNAKSSPLLLCPAAHALFISSLIIKSCERREKKKEVKLVVEIVIYFSVVDKFRPRICARLEACGGSANGTVRREL